MSTDVFKFRKDPSDGVSQEDIDAINQTNNEQDADLAFLNDLPAFRAFASPGSAITADGTVQTLTYDTVEYIHSIFDYTNGVLTYNGPTEKFHVSWSVIYEGSTIPILQSIGSGQAGVLKGDGTLLSLDTQVTEVSLEDTPLALKGGFDIELDMGDTIEVAYQINTSAAGVIVQILNSLGLGGTSQQVTHFSVHMI